MPTLVITIDVKTTRFVQTGNLHSTRGGQIVGVGKGGEGLEQSPPYILSLYHSG